MVAGKVVVRCGEYLRTHTVGTRGKGENEWWLVR